ncbi:Tic22-like [Gloeomargarita lithophora Alchichica-D10]|uniref:Tic22-like n=1 Tax=Gloeomargarita lithophora Alchichica-D10 TaxID=1188229 RepID=A0A1J0AGM3_9CYAN|nr:Tic22 family protein [Gloeomargarita lithophora]APB35063.1 Tic22-like [Gloeomargarita lithophora Alchichica-D10]
MNGFIRGGLIFSLLCGSGIGYHSNLTPAIAQGIPAKDIAEQLKQVPVFTLIDSSGKQSLTITVKDSGKDKEISFFFFSPQDAQTALQRVQTQNPALAKGAQIRAIGLDKAYELAKSIQQGKDQKFDVSFQPEGSQVDAALKILQAGGQKTDKFPGIPLFFITGGPQQAQLTVQVNDPKGGKSEEMAPMFFSRQDADAFLSEVKKQDPKVGETAKIQVSSLDRLVAIMEQKNDPQLRQLYFIPSSSALRFIQQQQGNTGNRPQTQPAPRPQASPAPRPQTAPAPAPKPPASPAPKP